TSVVAQVDVLRLEVEADLHRLSRVVAQVKGWTAPCPTAVAAEGSSIQCLPEPIGSPNLHLTVVTAAKTKPVPESQARALISRRHPHRWTHQPAGGAVAVIAVQDRGHHVAPGVGAA